LIRSTDNALGYVLNQGGTAHFSPDNRKAYDFALDYAVVSFRGILEGLEAKAFFEYLGAIDPALFSGPLAGFTQIDVEGSPTNNSMLFLQPATSKHQFVTGLFAAASTTDGARHVTVKDNGQPTTARAGVAFPGNDWVAFPGGDQYLAKLGNPSPRLLRALAVLRQQHLQARRSRRRDSRRRRRGVPGHSVHLSGRVTAPVDHWATGTDRPWTVWPRARRLQPSVERL
jgi:hypothetical protein